MIIFYDKKTGKIKGTIEGRVHGFVHMDQWVGNKDKTDRLVVHWIKRESDIYEPDVDSEEQKNIMIKLDKNPVSVYDYIVDIGSGKLIKSKGNK